MGKNKVCSVFGHRNTEDTPELRARLIATFEGLINSGTKAFLFGSRSSFDNICWEVITELKERYPDIRRILIRAEYPYAPQAYIDGYLRYYEETYMPENVKTAGRAAYIERNRYMVDNSDVCVFYYNESYIPQPKRTSKRAVSLHQPNSGTKIIFEYARSKKKIIVNTIARDKRKSNDYT